METEQALVRPGDGEKPMQHGCSKTSKADKMLVSSNEEQITKRKKNDASVVATDLNRYDAIFCKKFVEKIVTVDDIPSDVSCSVCGTVRNKKSLKIRVICRCLMQYFVT